MQRGEGLRACLIGNDRLEVDAYLRDLASAQTTKIAEFDTQILELSSEGQKLRSEIALLSSEVERYKCQEPVVIQAEREAAYWHLIVTEAARENARVILENAKAAAAVCDAQAQEIQREIAELRTEYAVYFDSVKSSVAQIAAPGSRLGKAGSEGLQPGSKVVMKLLPEGSKSQAFVESSAAGGRREFVAVGRKIVTQNNTPVGVIGQIITGKKSGEIVGCRVSDSVMKSVPNGTFIPVTAAVALRQDTVVVNTDYLEDAAPEQGSLVKGQGLTPEQLYSTLVQLVNSLPSQAVQQPGAQVAHPAPGASFPLQDDTSVDARARHPAVSDRELQKREVEPPPSVASRIAGKQMSYIVGKIAGRDLFGASGELVIGQGQQITPEVVERARAEGKIAELIVYMLIPGLDEGGEVRPD
jgi:hypothetical protein